MEEEKRGDSFSSKAKKEGIAFGASLQESWQYLKAIILGQVKKAKAKNEKEASEADLQTSRMQVEAADAAEKKKKQIGM